MKIRLRFAPSPTGFLHIGNLRSALFGYLLAKSLSGKFILRLEDTDQKREVDGAAESLIDILSWAGIKFDEGPHIGGPFAPYIQTERLTIYKKYIQELLANDKAYRCFCTPERLEVMRAEQTAKKMAPRYDRACRHLSQIEIEQKLQAGEKYVIRQKMPLNGEITVHDELRGDITFNAADLDDHVLIKSDGIPTYQFANIVDDHLMEISHVTRGDEWLSSFPKNILLYEAFGWTPPKYIHLPLILNKTGGKLSKRAGDVFVEDYRARGYLPEAIVNFCALLGWHAKDDKELYTLAELEEVFSIAGLGISPAIFDMEKLNYLNGYYIRQKTVAALTELCTPYLPAVDHNLLKKIVAVEQERLVALEDIKNVTFLFTDNIEYDKNLLIWKQLPLAEVKDNLEKIYAELKKIKDDDWTVPYLEKYLLDYLKNREVKTGDYLWPLRVALTGAKNSPGPFAVAWALGKELSLERIKQALDKI